MPRRNGVVQRRSPHPARRAGSGGNAHPASAARKGRALRRRHRVHAPQPHEHDVRPSHASRPRRRAHGKIQPRRLRRPATRSMARTTNPSPTPATSILPLLPCLRGGAASTASSATSPRRTSRRKPPKAPASGPGCGKTRRPPAGGQAMSRDGNTGGSAPRCPVFRDGRRGHARARHHPDHIWRGAGEAGGRAGIGENPLGHAGRCQQVQARLRRLHKSLRAGKRPVQHRPPRNRSAMDPQGDVARPPDRRHPHRRRHVPALRQPALRRCLPDRRLVQARGRHRAGGQAHLHRLPLLHDGLSFKARSFVHEDHEDQNTAAPRGKGVVESCNLCVDRIDAGKKPACVEACASKGGGALTFGDLNNPDSDIFRALRACRRRNCAPISNSMRACATPI